MGLLSFANSNLQMTGAVADLSIPLEFDGPQPNHFGAESAHAHPMKSGDFTGDTRLGGSCNAMSVTLNPHCNGTHTECVGHLTTSRVSINDVCPTLPLLAGLVSATTSDITYNGEPGLAVTLDNLEKPVLTLFEHSRSVINSTPTALAIRTLPNSIDKSSKKYTGQVDTAFIEPEAIKWLADNGIDHLLVDLPSIDPYSDGGKLAAHRQLFGLPEFDSCPNPDVSDSTRAHSTLTEMIYVSDQVLDGLYLLNLQIPPFSLDAAPSRPLLYGLESL